MRNLKFPHISDSDETAVLDIPVSYREVWAAAMHKVITAIEGGKYPARGHPLSPKVFKGPCVDSMSGLREVLLGLEGGTAPGTGGMKLKPEYLKCEAEV